MYCRSCGSKMPEDAIFCGRCGTQNDYNQRRFNFAGARPGMTRGNMTTGGMAEWNAIKVDMSKFATTVLMGIAVIWSMISGLVPLIEGSIPFTLSVEWSLVNMWKDFKFLADIGAEIDALIIICGVCIFFYLVSVLMGGRFFYDLFATTGNKNNIAGGAIGASVCSGIATVAIIIGHYIVNAETEHYMMGLTFLSVLPTGWINLIMAVLNVILFSGLYKRVTHPYYGRSMEKRDKECVVCGTKYLDGSHCPNCGSSYVKK